ncbi:MAG: hypothetical protein M3409_05895, partial [Gemmatimonadota bacterium]|nr:hypothetical protein [Gemmatimonadota bacterium]
MPPELNPLWIALEERRRQALGDLDREATRLAARPHARAWGRLEVIEHLVLVEEGTVRALRRPLPPGTRRRLRQRLGRAAVWLVFRFGIRVR